MDKKIEEQDPQKKPEVETEEKSEVEENKGEVIVEETPGKVEIPQSELDELKKKAEVSSQNFERAKKAEDKVKTLESLENNEVSSDYDDEKVEQLQSELSEIKDKLSKKDLLSLYPQLEELWDDFETYRGDEENTGMKLEIAAKAFLIEKGLLGAKRKGLEKATGGKKIPSSGMSIEDIENIRKNDGKKYREMLKKGLIKYKA